MKRFPLVFIAILTLMVCACAFKPLSPKEKANADLMPNQVALKILSKYGIGQNLYFQEAPLCGGKVVIVPVSELTQVVYFKAAKYLILRKRNFLCVVQMQINSVPTEADAREIVSALRALGANNIDEIKVMGFD
jgi:hypothetical protein